MNKNDVPNNLNAILTAPLVLTFVIALVLKRKSSTPANMNEVKIFVN